MGCLPRRCAFSWFTGGVTAVPGLLHCFSLTPSASNAFCPDILPSFSSLLNITTSQKILPLTFSRITALFSSYFTIWHCIIHGVIYIYLFFYPTEIYSLLGLCSLLYPKHPLECLAQCRHLICICGMFKNSHPQGFLSSELSSTQNSCVGPAQAEANWPPQPREAEPKIENTKAAGPGPQWLGKWFLHFRTNHPGS